jgi:hypothetical protein
MSFQTLRLTAKRMNIASLYTAKNMGKISTVVMLYLGRRSAGILRLILNCNKKNKSLN